MIKKLKSSNVKLVGGVILSIVLLLLSLLGLKQAILDSVFVVQSKHWDTTTGEIITEKMSQYFGRYVSGYHIEFKYKFIAEGKLYTGYNFTIPRMGYGSQFEVQNILATHPVGSTTTVYFDPENPNYSSIQNPSSNLNFAIMRMSAMLVVMAFSVFLLTRVIKNKGK